MRISARFFFFAFFSFLIFHFSFFISPVLAQAKTQQTNNYPVVNTNSDVPNTLHNWTQNVMIEVMSAMTCQIAGIDPVNPQQACLGIDQKSGKIGFVRPSTSSGYTSGGAIGVMGNLISVLYTPPLHTADYFQNLAANFGLAKKAYAQGTGFDSLKPLMALWSAFRNIVYLIFVIVFVVIGLAIMLRVKIDPRTVMTIQNQIPKIIIGILLVTFSFAIAGFLIDLMWVFIYLTYGVIAGIGDVGNLNPATIQGQNALRVAGHIATGGIFGITNNVAISIKDVVQNLLNIKSCGSVSACFVNIFNPIKVFWDVADPIQRGSVANWVIDILSYAAGYIGWNAVVNLKVPTFTTPFLGDILNSFVAVGSHTTALVTGQAFFSATEFTLRILLPYLIAYLIIFIAILFALFRLWFTLLMAYVYILLDVVLAPFWIIAGAVPGSPISFTGWLRDIGANLLAFPATIAMFLLGKVFMDAFGQPPTKDYFVPPLIGNASAPNVIGPLIGLGFILVTPNIVNLLKQMLKAPKIDVSSVGKSVGTGPRLATGVFGTLMQGLNVRYQWHILHSPKEAAARGQVPGINPPGGGKQ